jgi:hypothetical protein
MANITHGAIGRVNRLAILDESHTNAGAKRNSQKAVTALPNAEAVFC